MVRGHGPGAGRENDVRAHQPERAAYNLAARKGIGANHHAEGSQGRVRDGETIALGVRLVPDLEFVELAVMKDDLAFRIDEHGRVVNRVARLFYQSGAHEPV